MNKIRLHCPYNLFLFARKIIPNYESILHLVNIFKLSHFIGYRRLNLVYGLVCPNCEFI
jgi:hypothetical protein